MIIWYSIGIKYKAKAPVNRDPTGNLRVSATADKRGAFATWETCLFITTSPSVVRRLENTQNGKGRRIGTRISGRLDMYGQYSCIAFPALLNSARLPAFSNHRGQRVATTNCRAP
ncbi:hypothetical protein CYMTET_26116 [Cymbomonas tetramitiformis]|uniref:Uncharacterized protein n=1 Tax=Cymbomonas tetramitiformis TaxID=36881 RepID=A0AAE0FT63_9CHLO|nr:hypothetical protein CYMTET_26116 [Cymbomonas tetramitiformis]